MSQERLPFSGETEYVIVLFFSINLKYHNNPLGYFDGLVFEACQQQFIKPP